MGTWWIALDLAPKIFYGIGIVSGLMLLLQLVLTLLGADADDLDGADGDGGVLSIRTVTAFFVGFGWTGAALLGSGSSVPVATLAALFVGGLFMAGVFAMMRFVYGLQSSGTVDLSKAVGLSGTVYVPVAPKLQGTGQIEMLIQNRLRVLDARTHCERRLKRGEQVRVVEVTGTSTMMVMPENE